MPSLDPVERLRLDLCRSIAAGVRETEPAERAQEAAHRTYAALCDALPASAIDCIIRDAVLSMILRLLLNDGEWMMLAALLAHRFPAEFDQATGGEI